MLKKSLPWLSRVVQIQRQIAKNSRAKAALPKEEAMAFGAIHGGYPWLFKAPRRWPCFALSLGVLMATGQLALVQAASAEQSVSQDAAVAMRCAQRSDLVAWLSDGYEERSLGEGLTRQGVIMEVFVSESGRTWTLLYTRPDGISCLVSTGSAWEGELPSNPSAAGDGV